MRGRQKIARQIPLVTAVVAGFLWLVIALVPDADATRPASEAPTGRELLPAICGDQAGLCSQPRSEAVSSVGAEASTWQELFPATSPPERDFPALAFDDERGLLTLFGGRMLTQSFYDDTWEWDGEDWVERFPSGQPSARSAHDMAYDSLSGTAVLFGGWDGDFPITTWEWDGTNWYERVTGMSPSGRTAHRMSYDSQRGRVVLFGGYGGLYLDDTWEWNGSDWTERFPATVPPRRQYHVMAFDNNRNRTVMFGGAGSSSYLDDTWEWTGSNWVERTPAHSPPPTGYSGMVFDSDRGVMVLYDGVSESTWEYDGVDWVEREAAMWPGSRTDFDLAYDPVRRETILFGGAADEQKLNDTWTYRTLSLEVEPEELIIGPGRTARYAVTVNGSQREVELSTSAMPPGATAQFDPGSVVTPPEEVTLEIDTEPGMADGVYPIALTGQTDALTTTVLLELTVAKPDFGLKAIPPAWTIHAGSEITNQVAITASLTFSSYVVLAIEGLPAGVMGTIDPNPAPPDSVADVVLAASVGAEQGLHMLTLIGNGVIGATIVTRTVDVPLMVLPPYTPTPTPSATWTPSLTPTPTDTPTPSKTPTASQTPSRTPTGTSTATPVPSHTPTPTLMPTATLARSYLPAVIRPLPTPTATWTPVPTWTPNPTDTPTATATAVPPQPVDNGDFEDGRVGWIELTDPYRVLIRAASQLPVSPKSGSWAAWLGGAPNQDAMIYQEVMVPTSNPTLYYWHWVDSTDICNSEYDIAGVVVEYAGELEAVDAFTLCYPNNTNGWRSRMVSVSGYAGKSVVLYLAAFTNGTLNSNWFVDDVSLGSPLLGLRGTMIGEMRPGFTWWSMAGQPLIYQVSQTEREVRLALEQGFRE